MARIDRVREKLLETNPPAPVLDGVLRARSGLQRLRSAMAPIEADVVDRLFGLIEARALGIAAEFDLAEHLANGPLTALELAVMASANADALERLMSLLVEVGFFRLTPDGRYANNKRSDVLRSRHPRSMRNWARFFGGPMMADVFGRADHSVATGESATQLVTGHEFFEYVNDVAPEVGQQFNGAMSETARLVGENVARVYDFSTVQRVCDVGGGSGRFLTTLLGAHSHLRGVLFDLPSVLVDVELPSSIDAVGGSFFESVPKGSDCYTLIAVVHDWDDERARTILERVRQSVPPHGRVLVIEQVVNPDRPVFFARHTDLLMLVLTGAGRERTADQMKALCESAGFRLEKTISLPTAHVIFELMPRPL